MYINTPVYVGKILQLVVHPYSVCSLLRAIIQNTYTIHTAYTCILQEHENKIFDDMWQYWDYSGYISLFNIRTRIRFLYIFFLFTHKRVFSIEGIEKRMSFYDEHF